MLVSGRCSHCLRSARVYSSFSSIGLLLFSFDFTSLFFILSPCFSFLRFSWPCSRPSQPLHREMACREISKRWWRSRERVQSLPLFSACVHSSMFVDPPLFNVLSLIVTFDLYPPRGSHPSSLGRSSSIGGGGGSGQQRVQRLAAGPGSVSLVTAPHKGIAL